jgi:hypothetical protein
MDAPTGELGRQEGHLPGGHALVHAHDQAHVALAGLDLRERMYLQDLEGESVHLVGRHHPGAGRQQQHELGAQRGELQPPAGDRAHPLRGVQHHVHRG